MIRTRVRLAEHRQGALVAACLLFVGLVSVATPMAGAAASPTVITVGTPTLQARGVAVTMPLTVTCPSGTFPGPLTLSQSSGGAVLSEPVSFSALCDGTAHHELGVAVGEGIGLSLPWRPGPALLLIGGVPQAQQLRKVTIGTGPPVAPSKSSGLVLPSTITRIAGGLTLEVPVRFRCPHGEFGSVFVVVGERLGTNVVQGWFAEGTPLCTGNWQKTVVPVDAPHLLWKSGRSAWLSVDAGSDSVSFTAQGVVMVQ